VQLIEFFPEDFVLCDRGSVTCLRAAVMSLVAGDASHACCCCCCWLTCCAAGDACVVFLSTGVAVRVRVYP